jgi:hypothetical protein
VNVTLLDRTVTVIVLVRVVDPVFGISVYEKDALPLLPVVPEPAVTVSQAEEFEFATAVQEEFIDAVKPTAGWGPPVAGSVRLVRDKVRGGGFSIAMTRDPSLMYSRDGFCATSPNGIAVHNTTRLRKKSSFRSIFRLLSFPFR